MQLAEEGWLVLKTAQIEQNATRFDAPDDRNRQCPQPAGERLDGSARWADGAQGESGARQQRHRQRAAADLAECVDEADLGDTLERFFDDGQQALSEGG